MRSIPSLIPALMSAALVGGCAGNTVRLDAARTVTARGAEAAEAARAYFDAIELRRAQAAAALVASDPSCLPVTPLVIQIPRKATTRARAPLCVGERGTAPGHVAYPLDIGPSPRAVLEPRIAVLTAVADYCAALGRLVDDPDADVAAEIAAFSDQVGRVGRFAAFIGGTDLAGATAALKSAQGGSARDLLAFAAELAREAQAARKVRALVIARGDVVDRALLSLREQVEVWGRGSAATADDLYGNALFRSYLANRRTLSPEQRELLAARVFEARAASRAGPTRVAAVAEAIALTRQAQAGLRDALAGRFTRAQRRAVVRLNIDRMTRAMGLIAGLAIPT